MLKTVTGSIDLLLSQVRTSPSDYMYDGPQFGPLNIEINFKYPLKNLITQRVTRSYLVGPHRLELWTNGL